MGDIPEADGLEPLGEAAPVLYFAGLVLDLDALTLTRETGELISLTRGEFALLRIFVTRPGRVISRDTILDALANRRFEPFDRSVDVLVGRLRRKIEPDPKRPTIVVTVLGGGYKFAAAISKKKPTTPAILVADIAGYLRLISADEEGTVARLRALRSDLFDPTISLHHGRVVKRTGDSILIAFRSVVDAVGCSIEVQNGMVRRNAGLPPDRQILCRVGIHLGDVIEEADGDLIGDGVNVAAWLESICEPGGVCLSSAAYEQIRDTIAAEFVDLGERKLRNFARPVKAYAIPARSKDDRTTGHGRGSTAILNTELPLNPRRGTCRLPT